MGIDNPVHLIFLAAVALLVLGPKRLPEVARSLGKGIRDFREAMSDGSTGGFLHVQDDGLAGDPGSAAPAAPMSAPVAPPDAEVVADSSPARDAAPEDGGWGAVHTGAENVPSGAGWGAIHTGTETTSPAGGVADHYAVQSHGIEAIDAGDPPQPVDPGEPVRSGDAPDRRPL
jgi:sec-independent protein translocase protein TatA